MILFCDQEHVAAAACHSADADRWEREHDELMGRVAARFVRVESRRRVRSFARGLLSGVPRTN
jgi:hypothetical protein